MVYAIPCLGYPSKTDAAYALHCQGKSNAEIAEKIGETKRQVGSLVSNGRRRNGVISNKITIPRDLHAALKAYANALDIPVNDLAVKLLSAIAKDDLFNAVLDDAESTNGSGS